MEKENIINNFKMNRDGTVTINGGTFDKVLKIDFDGVGFGWPTVTVKFDVDGDFFVDLPKDNEDTNDSTDNSKSNNKSHGYSVTERIMKNPLLIQIFALSIQILAFVVILLKR